MSENLLKSITNSSTGPFKWVNEAPYEKIDEDTLLITAPGDTDVFTDPVGVNIKANAPYLYQEVEGDFRMIAHVGHEFKSTWDAAVLMLWDDQEKNAKLCFEKSDFGTKAIVSVVTNGVSDDANGVNYNWNNVWLQITRQGNIFALHYGPDGKNWNMVRLFRLDANKTIKIGMEAQCPAGEESKIYFYHFNIDNTPVKDLRAGV